MMKKLLFSLFLCLLAVPLSAQQSEAEREAMYYIRKAYDYSRERKTEEAFKYVKLFETYLEDNLSAETASSSIATYYLETLLFLLESNKINHFSSINWDIVYSFGMRLSKQKSPIGQYALGRYYYSQKKYIEAIEWYRKSAEQGFVSSQNYLGVMYYEGNGVAKDYAEAMKWFRKSAEQGDADAQKVLGMMYIYGSYYGVAKDYAEAMKWLRKSAEQGNAGAQNRLGEMYREGPYSGVARDYAEAVKWFLRSAEQGDAAGQNNLGEMYQRGYGVTRDYAEAVKWFRKSAEQGNADGQRHLGDMYNDGYGVAQDYTEALKWYRLSAEQGSVLGKLSYESLQQRMQKQ